MKGANRHLICRQTFPAMFDNSTLKYSDCVCQWYQDDLGVIRSKTYGQVARIVKEMASGLIYLGIKKQDRIALMSQNCPEWLWADFSILGAGAVTVTIYPTLSQREMAFILNDSGARFVFVEDQDNLTKVLNVWSEMPGLEKVIALREDLDLGHPDILTLQEVRDLGSRFLREYPLAYERRWRSVELYDRMTIMYTSGTTGDKKGVVHSHFSMNAALNRDFLICDPYSEDDVFLSILSLSHSYERECGQMIALASGASIAYASNPSNPFPDMMAFRPTVFMAVPRIFEKLYFALRDEIVVNHGDQRTFDEAIATGLEVVSRCTDQNGAIDLPFDPDLTEGLEPELATKYKQADERFFSKIRMLLGGRYRFSCSAAGSLPESLCRLFMAMNLPIFEGYGLMETCNTLTRCQFKIRPGSVGTVAPGVESSIADDGELLVRGDNLFIEYWNDPAATRAAFSRDGFFRTGDIVEELPGGYLKIVDRKKELIVLSNGQKVPAAKIENLFSMSRFIDQVCVLGDDNAFVAALVVPNFDAFISHYDESNITYNRQDLRFTGDVGEETCIKVGLDFLQNEFMKRTVEREIAWVNLQLEDFERIERYQIINRIFTEKANELTPNLKLKRKEIIKNFAVEIKQLYTEDDLYR
ncbi:MAG: long-chain fatty acid--CoA ligase [Syntrophomonadaceae bacterium]|nr:long-chain fatty acid--CoA ligase [Syntrophomonadaceae bacterium]